MKSLTHVSVLALVVLMLVCCPFSAAAGSGDGYADAGLGPAAGLADPVESAENGILSLPVHPGTPVAGPEHSVLSGEVPIEGAAVWNSDTFLNPMTKLVFSQGASLTVSGAEVVIAGDLDITAPAGEPVSMTLEGGSSLLLGSSVFKAPEQGCTVRFDLSGSLEVRLSDTSSAQKIGYAFSLDHVPAQPGDVFRIVSLTPAGYSEYVLTDVPPGLEATKVDVELSFSMDAQVYADSISKPGRTETLSDVKAHCMSSMSDTAAASADAELTVSAYGSTHADGVMSQGEAVQTSGYSYQMLEYTLGSTQASGFLSVVKAANITGTDPAGDFRFVLNNLSRSYGLTVPQDTVSASLQIRANSMTVSCTDDAAKKPFGISVSNPAVICSGDRAGVDAVFGSLDTFYGVRSVQQHQEKLCDFKLLVVSGVQFTGTFDSAVMNDQSFTKRPAAMGHSEDSYRSLAAQNFRLSADPSSDRYLLNMGSFTASMFSASSDVEADRSYTAVERSSSLSYRDFGSTVGIGESAMLDAPFAGMFSQAPFGPGEVIDRLGEVPYTLNAGNNLSERISYLHMEHSFDESVGTGVLTPQADNMPSVKDSDLQSDRKVRLTADTVTVSTSRYDSTLRLGLDIGNSVFTDVSRADFETPSVSRSGHDVRWTLSGLKLMLTGTDAADRKVIGDLHDAIVSKDSDVLRSAVIGMQHGTDLTDMSFEISSDRMTLKSTELSVSKEPAGTRYSSASSTYEVKGARMSYNDRAGKDLSLVFARWQGSMNSASTLWKSEKDCSSASTDRSFDVSFTLGHPSADISLDRKMDLLEILVCSESRPLDDRLDAVAAYTAETGSEINLRNAQYTDLASTGDGARSLPPDSRIAKSSAYLSARTVSGHQSSAENVLISYSTVSDTLFRFSSLRMQDDAVSGNQTGEVFGTSYEGFSIETVSLEMSSDASAAVDCLMHLFAHPEDDAGNAERILRFIKQDSATTVSIVCGGASFYTRDDCIRENGTTRPDKLSVYRELSSAVYSGTENCFTADISIANTVTGGTADLSADVSVTTAPTIRINRSSETSSVVFDGKDLVLSGDGRTGTAQAAGINGFQLAFRLTGYDVNTDRAGLRQMFSATATTMDAYVDTIAVEVSSKGLTERMRFSRNTIRFSDPALDAVTGGHGRFIAAMFDGAATEELDAVTEKAGDGPVFARDLKFRGLTWSVAEDGSGGLAVGADCSYMYGSIQDGGRKVTNTYGDPEIFGPVFVMGTGGTSYRSLQNGDAVFDVSGYGAYPADFLGTGLKDITVTVRPCVHNKEPYTSGLQVLVEPDGDLYGWNVDGTIYRVGSYYPVIEDHGKTKEAGTVITIHYGIDPPVPDGFLCLRVNDRFTIPLPQWEGHTFQGWFRNPGLYGISFQDTSVMEAGDTDYYAKWETNSHRLTFDTNSSGKVTVDPVDVVYGTDIGSKCPQYISRPNYRFAGWFFDPELSQPVKDSHVTMPDAPVTVYAKWTPVEYDLTYHYDIPGTPDRVLKVPYGTPIPLLDAHKEGYTFLGWYNKPRGGAQITEGTPMFGGASHIYAHWSINTYTISFDTGGGTLMRDISQKFGTAIKPVKDPTRTGYTFTGWDIPIPETMPAENLKITAQWEINQYTIRFVVDGGSTDYAITQDYGTEVAPQPDPVKTGHTFKGWSQTVPSVMPAKNMVIQARWQIDQYTVTFLITEGQVHYEICDDYGTYFDAPQDPVREGYTFMGWDRDVPPTIPEGDLTITAVWEAKRYTYRFDCSGGEPGSMEFTGDFGTPFELTTVPVLKGHTLIGWGREVPSTFIAENIDFKAVWEVNTYHVNLDTDGGNPMDPVPVKYGEPFPDLPPAVRTGYTFMGWEGEVPQVMSDCDVNLKALWKIKVNTITFETGGGTVLAPITGEFGTPVTPYDDPVREGYEFTGWDRPIPETIPADSITITAGWSIRTYTITFDTDGGTPLEPLSVVFGDPVPEFGTTEKIGHTFQEWSWTREIPQMMPAEDMDLKAVWKVNQHKVIFRTAGGIHMDTLIMDYGAPLEITEIPVREGYTFDGWDREIPPTMPDEDITLTATWHINSYVLEIITNGDSEVGKTTLVYADPLPEIADPTRTGYTFTGWDREIPARMPAHDLTVTATWQINRYTITLNVDGGEPMDPIVQDYDTPVTVPADAVRIGHTFLGWDKQFPANMPAHDMTITAQWSINQYTISFDSKGGNPVRDITQDYNTPVVSPDPPGMEGHSFGGWDQPIPDLMPAKNLHLTASWNVVDFRIIFDTRGGILLEDVWVPYGEPIPELPVPSKTGYTFDGWDQIIPPTMGAKNMTLHALWKIDQHTLYFDCQGGTPISPITANYHFPVVLPYEPERTGYTFVRWEPSLPENIPDHDMTITAIWQINSHTITYETGGGSYVEPVTGDYGTPVPKPSDPVRTGHMFIGWDRPIPESIPDRDLVINAEWQAHTYTLTFDPSGGSDVPEMTEDYGTLIEMPTPYLKGHRFIAWTGGDHQYKGGDLYRVDVGGMHFTANWEKIIEMEDLDFTEEGYVSVDLPNGLLNVQSDVVKQIAELERVFRVNCMGITVELPSEAVQTMCKDDFGFYRDLRVDLLRTAVPEGVYVTEENRKYLERADACLQIDVESTGKVTGLGDVNISLPFVPGPGFDMQYLTVLYVGDDGTVTEMPTEYADGRVSFVTSHFSTFIVTYTDAPPEPEPEPEDPAVVMERYLGLAYIAVFGILIFAGILLYVKRN